MENVNYFVYLGARIDASGKATTEIRRRLAIATAKLQKMMILWKSQIIPLKMKILNACIFPIATYGCESWTLTKADEKRINAFEMRCYRKMLRIPWTAKERNESVLNKVDLQNCQLLNQIKKQKLGYFGHTKRHDTLEKLCMEGAVEGRRGRGRPRRRWTQDIADWMGKTTTEAGHQALEREDFRKTVWEATSDKDPP